MFRQELQEYLIDKLGISGDKVSFAMSLLEIIDSRHCRDIKEHLEKEYEATND